MSDSTDQPNSAVRTRPAGKFVYPRQIETETGSDDPSKEPILDDLDFRSPELRVRAVHVIDEGGSDSAESVDDNENAPLPTFPPIGADGQQEHALTSPQEGSRSGLTSSPSSSRVSRQSTPIDFDESAHHQPSSQTTQAEQSELSLATGPTALTQQMPLAPPTSQPPHPLPQQHALPDQHRQDRTPSPISSASTSRPLSRADAQQSRPQPFPGEGQQEQQTHTPSHTQSQTHQRQALPLQPQHHTQHAESSLPQQQQQQQGPPPVHVGPEALLAIAALQKQLNQLQAQILPGSASTSNTPGEQLTQASSLAPHTHNQTPQRTPTSSFVSTHNTNRAHVAPHQQVPIRFPLSPALTPSRASGQVLRSSSRTHLTPPHTPTHIPPLSSLAKSPSSSGEAKLSHGAALDRVEELERVVQAMTNLMTQKQKEVAALQQARHEMALLRQTVAATQRRAVKYKMRSLVYKNKIEALEAREPEPSQSLTSRTSSWIFGSSPQASREVSQYQPASAEQSSDSDWELPAIAGFATINTTNLPNRRESFTPESPLSTASAPLLRGPLSPRDCLPASAQMRAPTRIVGHVRTNSARVVDPFACLAAEDTSPDVAILMKQKPGRQRSRPGKQKSKPRGAVVLDMNQLQLARPERTQSTPTRHSRHPRTSDSDSGRRTPSPSSRQGRGDLVSRSETQVGSPTSPTETPPRHPGRKTTCPLPHTRSQSLTGLPNRQITPQRVPSPIPSLSALPSVDELHNAPSPATTPPPQTQTQSQPQPQAQAQTHTRSQTQPQSEIQPQRQPQARVRRASVSERGGGGRGTSVSERGTSAASRRSPEGRKSPREGRRSPEEQRVQQRMKMARDLARKKVRTQTGNRQVTVTSREQQKVLMVRKAKKREAEKLAQKRAARHSATRSYPRTKSAGSSGNGFIFGSGSLFG